jgi:hypothetical protein
MEILRPTEETQKASARWFTGVSDEEYSAAPSSDSP